MKIAITGSLASGKTSATKFLSKKKYPVFNADNVRETAIFSNIIYKKSKKKI